MAKQKINNLKIDKATAKPQSFFGVYKKLGEHRHRITMEKPKYKPTSLASTEEHLLKLSKDAMFPVPVWVPNKIKLDKVRPTVLYYPGTGYIADEVEFRALICSHMAEYSNCQIIIIKSPLAPENQFPKGLNTALQLTQKILKQCPRFKIDVNNIFLAGYSSGGNFALSVATELNKQRTFLDKLLSTKKFSVKFYEENIEVIKKIAPKTGGIIEAYLELIEITFNKVHKTFAHSKTAEKKLNMSVSDSQPRKSLVLYIKNKLAELRKNSGIDKLKGIKMPEFKAIVLIGPQVDLFREGQYKQYKTAADKTIPREFLEWIIKLYIPEGKKHTDKEISPIYRDLAEFKGLCPIKFVYGENSGFRSEIEAIKVRLLSAGIEVESLMRKGVGHAFWWQEKQTFCDVGSMLKELLKDGKSSCRPEIHTKSVYEYHNSRFRAKL